MTDSQKTSASTRLSGKVVLVTGAGSGIGRAAALAFAREGARVALAGRRVAELEAVASEIRLAHGEAAVIPTDLSEPASAKALVDSVVANFGRLDAAFNNAGVSTYAPVEQLDAAEIDRVFATNVRAVLLLVQHEVQAMRAHGQGGAIVNTSSIAATGGTAGLSVYAASKGALDSMIRPIALETGEQGIRINNVAPGVTKTPMTAALPPEAIGFYGAHTALKRLADPEDVSRVAVWLCTDEARFVTGQSILVDGGFNIAGAR